jgi:hypothetical protein
MRASISPTLSNREDSSVYPTVSAPKGAVFCHLFTGTETYAVSFRYQIWRRGFHQLSCRYIFNTSRSLAGGLNYVIVDLLLFLELS